MAISHHYNNSDRVLVGFLLGIVARMLLPLGVGLAGHLLGGPLAEGGLLYYLLMFYPVALSVETALSLPSTSSATRTPPTQ